MNRSGRVPQVSPVLESYSVALAENIVRERIIKSVSADILK